MGTGAVLIGRGVLRGAAVAAVVLAAAAPALAQVTLRIEPAAVFFPTTSPPPPFASFDVFIDNVPAGGLGSFAVVLNEQDTSEFRKCLDFETAVLDPNLVIAWNQNNPPPPSVSNDILTWTVNALGPGRSSPGTVRIGTITYETRLINVDHDMDPNTPPVPAPNCALGTQRNFSWETSSRWSTDASASPGGGGMAFDSLRGSPWIIGPQPDIDLTVDCTRVMAPNDTPGFFDAGIFVDGQTVQLECTVSNLGTDPNMGPPISSTLVSRFSDDLVIDSGDSAIGQVDGIPLGAGGMVDRTLSATPLFTTPKITNICSKIDAIVTDLDNAGGAIFETDETNNVDCDPVTVLAPQKDLVIDPNFVDPNDVDPNVADPNAIDILLTPSLVDPNNFHAGLTFQVSYGILNQGVGAVRIDYRNRIHLGASLNIIQANPNGTLRCSKLVDLGGTIPFHKGRSSLTQTFGFDPDASDPNVPADPSEICQIPFTLPPGNYVLAVQVDGLNNVVEEDPNGATLPAEANNWASVPIRVEAALPPEFRVRENATGIADLNVDIFEPPTTALPGIAAISLISAQNVGSYELTLGWDPNLAAVVDPNVDPNAIDFTMFLEENGRDQDCDIDNLDQSAGTLSVSCRTFCTDPNASCAGATTEGHSTLLTVKFRAVFPGSGALTLSSVRAADPFGNPIATDPPLRITNGTFTVSGVPKLRVINAVPPTGIVPGFPFSTSYDIENFGFGPAPTPILSRLILSRDAITDPISPAPDVVACTVNETFPIGGLTTRNKSLTTCRLLDDAIPGGYTGFYQVDPAGFGLDPNNWDVVTLPVPSRIAVLRKSGRGRILETYLEPDPNGTTGAALASAVKFNALGVSVVGSESRSLNWMVGLKKSSSGPRRLQLRALPKSEGEVLDVLTSLRLPNDVRAVLGGIDVDGDREDELILLRSVKGSGDVLDMRRIDFRQRKPLICQSAALTMESFFTAGVVDAAGIEYDGDTTSDELAVVTDDGVLTIYDLTLTGSPPPPFPCLAVPSTIHRNPAIVDLVPLASDTGFGAPGDQVLSICTLDFGLDGLEEIAGLHEDGSGLQALRIYGTPASLGGTATLFAEDAAFGGTQSRARAIAIACTR